MSDLCLATDILNDFRVMSYSVCAMNARLTCYAPSDVECSAAMMLLHNSGSFLGLRGSFECPQHNDNPAAFCKHEH
jgi:hypothetical protein